MVTFNGPWKVSGYLKADKTLNTTNEIHLIFALGCFTNHLGKSMDYITYCECWDCHY